MAAEPCFVVGCESSAYTVHNLTPNREWASLPAEVAVCNLHKEELENPDTEWMLERSERKLYVGDSLRDLNEYVLVGIPSTNLIGYAAGREFSHGSEDGHHLKLQVRRRGDRDKEITLVIPWSGDMAKELKSWVNLLPGDD